MSSATPGQGAAEDARQPHPDAESGTRPAQAHDRSAIRTSLSERFAAARGVAEHPVVPRPDDAAPVTATAATPVRPDAASGGSAQAPRYGATAPVAAHQPDPKMRPETQRPAGAAAPGPAAQPASAGPRKVRLSVARVDPWSVMKLAFLLSIAIGIAMVVAAAVVWLVLDSMQVFADIEELLLTLDSESFLQLMDYLQFDRVISLAAIIAVLDILLLTALATLGAFLYNIVAALVGGVHLTLSDD